MRILIISDGHGNVENLELLKKMESSADCVIYAGDFAAFQKPETGEPFLKALLGLNKNIFAVLGNCDEPKFESLLKQKNISVTGQVREFNGYHFLGSGGGSKFTGTTPYERTDEELVSDLTIIDELIDVNVLKNIVGNLILICHNPPYGKKVDKVAPLVHVGSKGITQFIEKYKPILVVSGHIHEAFGIDKIDNTVLVNPGALLEGRYAVAEINNFNDSVDINIELKTLF